MASETTPPAQPDPLVMPADEFAALKTVAEAAGGQPWTPEEIAGFRERFAAAMAKPRPVMVLPSDRWKARAEAAEAKLAEVRELAGQLVTATHPTIGGTFAASIGHKFLAITGTDEEPRDA